MAVLTAVAIFHFLFTCPNSLSRRFRSLPQGEPGARVPGIDQERVGKFMRKSKGRRKVGRKKRRMRAKIRHRK
jgi:hypothetical protein